MKKRYKMKKRASKRSFSKHASRTHRFNTTQYVMRGGIRM